MQQTNGDRGRLKRRFKSFHSARTQKCFHEAPVVTCWAREGRSKRAVHSWKKRKKEEKKTPSDPGLNERHGNNHLIQMKPARLAA